MRIRDALDSYLSEHGPRIRSVVQATVACRRWRRFWGDSTVAEMTRERQERFHAWLDAAGSPAYTRRTLGVGRAALAFCGQSLPVVVHYVAPFTRRERSRKLITLEGAQALWGAAQRLEHWRRYLWLAFGTGARPEALLQLRRDQIEGGVIHLAPEGWRPTKKRRPSLPMPALLEREVSGWDGELLVNWRGKPIARAVEMFKRLSRESGVEASGYSIRRAVATELHRSGVDAHEISIWLGHAPPGSSTTATYIHYRMDFLHSARDAVDTYLRKVGGGLSPAKSLNLLVGARGIEPRTPTMSRDDCQPLPDEWQWLQE